VQSEAKGWVPIVVKLEQEEEQAPDAKKMQSKLTSRLSTSPTEPAAAPPLAAATGSGRRRSIPRIRRVRRGDRNLGREGVVAWPTRRADEPSQLRCSASHRAEQPPPPRDVGGLLLSFPFSTKQSAAPETSHPEI